MPISHTLISTVGTSLFMSNLAHLKENENGDLKQAYTTQNWLSTAKLLTHQNPNQRICGAEINSIESLISHKYIDSKARLIFLHSDTTIGFDTAKVICEYYKIKDFIAESYCIKDLQDENPDLFASSGLRYLVKEISNSIRLYGKEHTAINATGGYKAQIAIATMLGQSLGVPVYYKHERFNKIIAFPPLPVSLDMEIWEKHSHVFNSLSIGKSSLLSKEELSFEDAPFIFCDALKSLLDEEIIDKIPYYALTSTGQIFHETFSHHVAEFSKHKKLKPSQQKKEPRIENSGHLRSHAKFKSYLIKLTKDIPSIHGCSTFYYNPDLPVANHFRISSKGLEGWYGEKGWRAGFIIDSTTENKNEMLSLMTECTNWLEKEF